MRRNTIKRWVLRTAVALIAIIGILFVIAQVMAMRMDPKLRSEAERYLAERFESDVEVGSLRVRLSALAPLRLLFLAGQGTLVTVSGENIHLRHRGRRDIPPMFTLRAFTASLDLGTVFGDTKTVRQVTLDGMEINLPPKGERVGFTGKSGGEEPAPQVVVDEVLVRDAVLRLFPKDKNKTPLQFDLRDIRLESAGKDTAMKYEAVLTNPRPPGEIHSKGTFGPWASGEPGDTPLGGDYVFENADLGIFTGIAGILHSTGTFEGTLSSITARGEATVPDFRLKRANNPISLKTRFEVLVDGTNGNTRLQPVHAVLGSTEFTTSGGVIEHQGEEGKRITLEAEMPNGNLRDVLTLAMKGEPIMDGVIELHTKIGIPSKREQPGKVKERLLLDGTFQVPSGKFLDLKIQSKIDALSNRAQGQGENKNREDVFHHMVGEFSMGDGVLTFLPIAFAMPGAVVNVSGDLDMETQEIDFRGALLMDAKVSETQTSWKRWVLKPLDPFFSRDGNGFLKIKITGKSNDPKFGLDLGGGDHPDK